MTKYILRQNQKQTQKRHQRNKVSQYINDKGEIHQKVTYILYILAPQYLNRYSIQIDKIHFQTLQAPLPQENLPNDCLLTQILGSFLVTLTGSYNSFSLLSYQMPLLSQNWNHLLYSQCQVTNMIQSKYPKHVCLRNKCLKILFIYK